MDCKTKPMGPSGGERGTRREPRRTVRQDENILLFVSPKRTMSASPAPVSVGKPQVNNFDETWVI
jgi:hypothetical protein